ncbi:MAG: Asp-tRNA(Asn)/Glu-tRNA(Gln) amidotransferase subunit GatB [Gemmatimonadota bacterium]
MGDSPLEPRALLETVIGLEIHVQLRTATKLFCGDSTVFGAPPNSQVCPVCLGLPGALPVLDHAAVGLAARAAAALGCRLHPVSIFARKNYFYPDMPKGYQISQFQEPLATEGSFEFEMPEGEGAVRIRRVHMEEDAGKSIHDRIVGATAVDLNRAGTPLVEIVTEPDLSSPEEAHAFLQELKLLLEALDVSDCNMEEGSLRVDANISLRPVGQGVLGTKVEIKNLNTFSGVEKALRLEIERQTEVISSGGEIRQETLLWDDHRGALRSMRGKEESHDYRYFPEPDLPPLVLTPSFITQVQEELPEAPRIRRHRFQMSLGLSEYDAGVLVRTPGLADGFEAVVSLGSPPKEVANWLMGPFLKEAGARGLTLRPFPLSPLWMARLLELVGNGTISGGMGKELLARLLGGEGDPDTLVERHGMTQIRDEAQLEHWIESSLEANPEELKRFQGGETRLLGYFMGEVMKRSRGQADPGRVKELLAARLSG